MMKKHSFAFSGVYCFVSKVLIAAMFMTVLWSQTTSAEDKEAEYKALQAEIAALKIKNAEQDKMLGIIISILEKQTLERQVQIKDYYETLKNENEAYLKQLDEFNKRKELEKQEYDKRVEEYRQRQEAENAEYQERVEENRKKMEAYQQLKKELTEEYERRMQEYEPK